MVQALLLTFAMVALAGVLAQATGSRWPMALLMVGLLGQSVLRLDWRREILGPYRHIRPRHVLVALAALTVPVTVFWLSAEVPLLNWSLFNLVGLDEGGNVAGAGLQVGAWFALPYALLLLACLPVLALIEEYWFRRGTRGWRDGLWRSVLFGLVHMVVGVPLGVAVFGLTPIGLLFTAVYLRAQRTPVPDDAPWAFGTRRFMISDAERRGIDASALQHLAYNAVALSLALLAIMLEPVGRS
jgi:hypothetical protein